MIHVGITVYDPKTKIYRYLDLETFMLSIINGLRLTSCSKYWACEDDHDGNMSQWTYKAINEVCRKTSDLLQDAADQLQVPNIFNAPPRQKDDLWTKFAKSSLGLMLETSAAELETAIFKFAMPQQLSVHCQNVEYITPYSQLMVEEAEARLFGRNSGQYKVLAHIFIKNSQFDREHEFRIAVHDWGNPIPTASDGNIYMPSFPSMINHVWIHTQSSQRYTYLIKDILRSAGSSADITLIRDFY
jgi:hypothetical protein